MKVGTGSKALCLDNNSGYALPPGPSLVDRGEPDPVQTSSHSASQYHEVPPRVIQDPYAGMDRAQLLEILLWSRALHQDPQYPELFRKAWSNGRT